MAPTQARHVAPHVPHAIRRLNGDAACVEGDAFADESDRRQVELSLPAQHYEERRIR
jgi:hypothetical protein